MRVWNTEVFDNLDGVAQSILVELERLAIRPRHRRPARAISPAPSGGRVSGRQSRVRANCWARGAKAAFDRGG